MVLLHLQAQLSGYALAPNTTPSLYKQLELEEKTNQYFDDVRSLNQLVKCLEETKPEIIFHLAAQPLVRESYVTPLETFDTNVMGTANLLEAVRLTKLPVTVICITSDKSYENKEWLYGYRETDPVGGYDPYSASKGAAELVISSYRRSFFDPEKIAEHGVKIASARAGNVIGGGDWATDRIVPDCIRSLYNEKEIIVRNPAATRPWQHVLEPVVGYLLLGARLLQEETPSGLCEAFNFGPLINSNKSVQSLVDEIIQIWGSGSWDNKGNKGEFHEATLLNLTIDKAYHRLKWQPIWDFQSTLKYTVDWYKNTQHTDDFKAITEDQINSYISSFKFCS